MESLSVQLDLVGIAVFGTAVALFFWLMRAFGAWLVQTGEGGPGEGIGKAIVSVYA